jgi:predicted phage terminase large subunit-like protein
MIFMPPRHGKSQLTSEFFPAWYLGHHPDRYIIATTYAQELADDFGRKVRNQLQDPLYKAIFPECQISPDSASASKFNTIQKGSYFAVGVGGPITGRGAHVLLIDDATKGREDAESETQRRKQKEWYQSVARTRLMPDGAIVGINTRWHEDDLPGWLLSAHSHEDWEVINLPAISEDNKPLWPEMYDLKTLEAIRESIGMRDWNALYQQNPIPDAGDFFKREWFQFYDTPPTGMYIYGASDFAVTEGKGDFTEHGIFGIDSENNIYILDWWSGQTNSDDWINSMLDLQDQWKTFRWFGESGVIRRAIEPMLAKRMEERKVYLNREWMASMADKATRARNFQNRAAGRKVFLPRRTQWAADLLSQIVRFPAGLHDDKVDVCSLIGRGLQFASAPSASNVKSIDAYRMKKSKSTSPWAA